MTALRARLKVGQGCRAFAAQLSQKLSSFGAQALTFRLESRAYSFRCVAVFAFSLRKRDFLLMRSLGLLPQPCTLFLEPIQGFGEFGGAGWQHGLRCGDDLLRQTQASCHSKPIALSYCVRFQPIERRQMLG